MHCFSIREPVIGEVQPGIRIFPYKPVGLRWGSSQADKTEVIPINKGQYKAVKALLDEGIISPDRACVLVRADMYLAEHPERGKELRFEQEQDPYDPRALVYVGTQTIVDEYGTHHREQLPDGAEPNKVTFTADTYKHVEIKDGNWARVYRRYDSFSEVVGITVLGTKLIDAEGAQWEEALLVLQPNASFRIVRGGDTRDLIPEFRVTWSGQHLRTPVSTRYRSRLDALR